MSGDRARKEVTHMGGDDGNHFPFDFGEVGSGQVFIDTGGEGFGVALIPGACNWGGMKVNHKIIVA